MRHSGRAVLVTILGVLLAGCTTPAVDRAQAPGPVEPTEAVTTQPAVIRDCWVPTEVGNVSLTGAQARDLTTRAADLGDTSAKSFARRAARLATAVVRATATDPGTARGIADGLAGKRRGTRLVCSYARTTVDPQEPGRSGLVPRARQLRTAWTEVFGALPAGGFARGGVSTGHVDGSAHYEGRAVDVFFRPVDDAEQRRRGWVFAQWLVAHAPDHNVLSVIYDDHIWTSWAAFAGWRDYIHPGATEGNRGSAVQRHREHVHVAVESGRPYRGR